MGFFDKIVGNISKIKCSGGSEPRGQVLTCPKCGKNWTGEPGVKYFQPNVVCSNCTKMEN